LVKRKRQNQYAHIGFIVNSLPGGKAPGDCGEAKATKLSFVKAFSECAEPPPSPLFSGAPYPYLLHTREEKQNGKINHITDGCWSYRGGY
jgi:hypothetical protein